MSHWAVTDSGRFSQFRTACTANASANTKGSWAQVSSAVPFDVHAVWISLGGMGSDFQTTGALVDIGIGASGSEAVIIPNLLCSLNCGSSSTTPGGQFGGVMVPCYIPKGQRLAIRCQASTGGRSVSLITNLIGRGFKGERARGRCYAYGPNTATSRAVGLTIPSSGSTAWTQLTAGTSAFHSFLMLAFAPDFITYDVDLTLAVAVGAAGSESAIWTLNQVIRPQANANQQVSVSNWHALPLNLAAGTRLSTRLTFNAGTTNSEQVHVAAYGVG